MVWKRSGRGNEEIKHSILEMLYSGEELGDESRFQGNIQASHRTCGVFSKGMLIKALCKIWTHLKKICGPQ